MTKYKQNPIVTPEIAATSASTVAITLTCRIVAPAKRIAAKRCSRRAADSRIAAPTNTRTGKSRTSAKTARMI